MADAGSASSAWAPLRIGPFRTLWIAALVSNVGTWMQTVGAQWLVVHDAHAAILVALVQTAYTLPAVLFALVAGVLADIFDRVKLLVAVLAGMTVTGAALTVLTAAHRMPPALERPLWLASILESSLCAPTHRVFWSSLREAW
jgi:MFS family permease